jgi:hypothetical protein
MALMSISVAKYQTWARLADKEQTSIFNAQYKNILHEQIHDRNYFFKLSFGPEL